MAIIRTQSRKPISFYDGASYAPDAIGNYIAVDERDYPWNTIGKALGSSRGTGTTTDGLLTAADVLAATGMDMHVEKLPVTAVDGDGNRYDLPRMFATGVIENGEFQPFGAVSDKYEVVQPADALSFFDRVISDVDGAHYSAAWQMREKSMMGVTIELPDEVVVDPGGANDRLAMHILGWNSYDGSTGLVGALDTTRLWCMNQVAPAIKRAPRSFSLRHTRNVTNRAHEAATLIGVTRNYAREFDAIANQLYQEGMSDGAFEMFLETLPPFAMDEDTPERTRRTVEARREETMETWRAPHNENVTGTKWGALNVVAEYMEWGRKVQGSPRTGTDPVRQRAIGTLVSPPVTGIVTRATEVLLGV